MTIPYLKLTNADGCCSRIEIAGQGFVFAGTGISCGVPLKGPTVSQFHCMFYWNETGFWVNDCQTGGHTLLNGRPIDSEACLNHGDHLAIGDNDLQVFLHEEPAASPILSLSATPAEPYPAQPYTTEGYDIRFTDPVPKFSKSLSLDDILDALPEESGDHPAYEFSHSEGDSDVAVPFDQTDPAADFAAQEMELLRSEIEHLQSELSQRDAELDVLREQQQLLAEPMESTCGEDVERLVHRLEELLGELRDADERQRSIEELLRRAEEANMAEQEERRQLERWIDEIEARVSQREAESAAEIARAQARSQEVQEQLKRAEAHIRKLMLPANDHSTMQVSREMLLELRSRQEELQDQLRSARDENETLRQTPPSPSNASPEHVQALEQRLAELELGSARERADLARQRMELEQLRSELDRKAKEQVGLSDSDSRFAVLRQHLRERHEEDKEARRKTLTGRIANLLGRV